MTPENQHVRTRGAARPRNLAVGCLAVLVVLLACGLLARFVRDEDADEPVGQEVGGAVGQEVGESEAEWSRRRLDPIATVAHDRLTD